MNYYNEIKQELINNEIYKRVKDYSKNKRDLTTYYNVGKILAEAGKHYGEGIIKEYSVKLTQELGKGYNSSSLKIMRQFYFIIKKGATMSHQLTWSHYCELIAINKLNEIEYYINEIIVKNLSIRDLRYKIRNKEYKRLDDSTRKKLINKEKIEIQESIKNPIIIKNTFNQENISEKILQQIIMEDIPLFLDELGEKFCFIKNEYKIKIGNNYNYIDLLLYNIKYNCYTVIELKVTPLKKEHIGQIETYMNYIDKNVKEPNQEKNNRYYYL